VRVWTYGCGQLLRSYSSRTEESSVKIPVGSLRDYPSTSVSRQQLCLEVGKSTRRYINTCTRNRIETTRTVSTETYSTDKHARTHTHTHTHTQPTSYSHIEHTHMPFQTTTLVTEKNFRLPSHGPSAWPRAHTRTSIDIFHPLHTASLSKRPIASTEPRPLRSNAPLDVWMAYGST
jgi:hypothetical protein